MSPSPRSHSMVNQLDHQSPVHRPLSTISEISVGACRPQDNLTIKISPIAHHISYDSILSRMSSPTGTLDDDQVQDQISISPAISPRQGTTPSVVPVRRPLFFNDDSLSVHPSDVESENEDEEEPYGQVRYHQQFRQEHEDDREVGLASDDDDDTGPMGRCMPMPIWEHHPPPRTFPEDDWDEDDVVVTLQPMSPSSPVPSMAVPSTPTRSIHPIVGGNETSDVNYHQHPFIYDNLPYIVEKNGDQPPRSPFRVESPIIFASAQSLADSSADADDIGDPRPLSPLPGHMVFPAPIVAPTLDLFNPIIPLGRMSCSSGSSGTAVTQNSPKRTSLALSPETKVASNGSGFAVSLNVDVSELLSSSNPTSQPTPPFATPRILSVTSTSATVSALRSSPTVASAPKHRFSQLFSRWGKKDITSSKAQNPAALTRKYTVFLEVEVEVKIGTEAEVRTEARKAFDVYRHPPQSGFAFGSNASVPSMAKGEEDLPRKTGLKTFLRQVLEKQ